MGSTYARVSDLACPVSFATVQRTCVVGFVVVVVQWSSSRADNFYTPKMKKIKKIAKENKH